jgi:hypothetical protein
VKFRFIHAPHERIIDSLNLIEAQNIITRLIEKVKCANFLLYLSLHKAAKETLLRKRHLSDPEVDGPVIIGCV